MATNAALLAQDGADFLLAAAQYSSLAVITALLSAPLTNIGNEDNSLHSLNIKDYARRRADDETRAAIVAFVDAEYSRRENAAMLIYQGVRSPVQNRSRSVGPVGALPVRPALFP